MVGNYDTVERMLREAADIVYQIIQPREARHLRHQRRRRRFGLGIALMADISIMSQDARLTDGHLRLGVAAGDHAAIIWPLLCGMAKAKYYLLTSDFIDGREADRIGLVSMAVPADEVLPKALEVAERLALGPQMALRWTKRALNNWIRLAGPIFDTSLALEMLGFMSDDAAEGLRALQERRAPVFPSAHNS